MASGHSRSGAQRAGRRESAIRQRAQARGGLAAAAAFLHRSVVLSNDPTQRVRRALPLPKRACMPASSAARSSCWRAEPSTLDELQMAQSSCSGVRSRSRRAWGPVRRRCSESCSTPRAARPRACARDLPRRVGSCPVRRSLGLHRQPARGIRRRHIGSASERPERASDLLLDSLATAVTQGRATAAPLLRRTVAAFVDEASAGQENFRWG